MPAVLPEFCGLDRLKPVRVYRRSLPHWRQDGATYFVTFRLVDSIPPGKVREWQYQRECWYAAHGLSRDLLPDEWQTRYQAVSVAERDEFERRAARQLFVELDRCHGACILRHEPAIGIVREALHFSDGLRYRCGDAVVMPNHVHWLLLPLPGHELEDILGVIKGYTAREINKHFGNSGSVWQHESYDRLVRDSAELARTRTYIARNPALARLPPRDRAWQAEWLAQVQVSRLDGWPS